MSAVDEEKRCDIGWRGGNGPTGGMVLPFRPCPPVLPVPPKKRPRQRLELVVITAGVSKTGEIHEVEWLSTSSRDAIDVHKSGLAGCRAGARDFLPDQRVNQTRLPDVRTPH